MRWALEGQGGLRVRERAALALALAQQQEEEEEEVVVVVVVLTKVLGWEWGLACKKQSKKYSKCWCLLCG